MASGLYDPESAMGDKEIQRYGDGREADVVDAAGNRVLHLSLERLVGSLRLVGDGADVYAGASELGIEPVAGLGGEELPRGVLVLGVAGDVPLVELLALLSLVEVAAAVPSLGFHGWGSGSDTMGRGPQSVAALYISVAVMSRYFPLIGGRCA
jgi:hypothetical protein